MNALLPSLSNQFPHPQEHQASPAGLAEGLAHLSHTRARSGNFQQEDVGMERARSHSRASHLVVWGVATLFSVAWAILAVSVSLPF
jgi:hypothetical protein